MSIRIKNQYGVVVNNVDGDQVIYGGQHGTVVTSEDARRAIRDLREHWRAPPPRRRPAAQARPRRGDRRNSITSPRLAAGRSASPNGS
jgi:hypothetical protein